MSFIKFKKEEVRNMNKFYSAIMFMLFGMSLSGCAYRQITVPQVTDSEFATAYRNDLKTLASDEFRSIRDASRSAVRMEKTYN